jgi:hypothetical protein
MSKYYIYIENFIESLQTLASKKFQEVAWFDNDQGLCYSYGENVSDLFDDNNIAEILDNPQEILISREVHQAMRDLDIVVDIVNYKKPEYEIIDSPEMEIVRQKAAHILNLIKASDGSESTVGFIKVGTTDVPISIQEGFKNNHLERFKILC